MECVLNYIPLVVIHATTLSFGDLVPLPPSLQIVFTTSFFKDVTITRNSMSFKGFLPPLCGTLAIELKDPAAELTPLLVDESIKKTLFLGVQSGMRSPLFSNMCNFFCHN